MPKNKHTDPAQAQSSIKALYNMLMFDVEPDLTTTMLPRLAFEYEDETEEEYKARMEWYGQALDLVAKRMDILATLWKQEMVNLKDAILESCRKRLHKEDAEHLGNVETSIDDLPPHA